MRDGLSTVHYIRQHYICLCNKRKLSRKRGTELSRRHLEPEFAVPLFCFSFSDFTSA